MATYRGSSIQRWLLEASRTKCCMDRRTTYFLIRGGEGRGEGLPCGKNQKGPLGLENVSSVVDLGYGAEEITMLTGKNA